MSSLWHTNNGLKGAHRALPPELGEGQEVLKPRSPKPSLTRFRQIVGRPTQCTEHARNEIGPLNCERGGPVQGSKSPKPGKEVFGVEKTPFSHQRGKGQFESENPRFPCGAGQHRGKRGFSDSNCPFPR